jgi:putative DNA primase/helicase
VSTPPIPTPPPSIDPQSDAELAEWMSTRLRNEMLWTPGIGWMRRTGQCWEPELQPLVTISDLLKRRAWELMSLASSNPRRIRDLQSTVVATAVEKLLRGRLQETGMFDADPYALNCPNGVVDLRTGKLRAHSATDRFMRSTRVPYLPGTTSEAWDAALQSVDPEVRDFLQLRLGHGLTACPPPDDRLLLMVGAGDNGKSTFVDGAVIALGDYAAKVSERVLMYEPTVSIAFSSTTWKWSRSDRSRCP